MRTLGLGLYKVKKIPWWIQNVWQNSICNSPCIPDWLRSFMYSLYGHKVKRVFSNCFLGPGPGRLYIGNNTYCNCGCFFELGDDIIIGNNVCVAMNVHFINSTHHIGGHDMRGGVGYTNRIKVMDGCWICAGCTILPGVTIGEGCVIAAGSVVNKDCAPDGLYAGVPAKRIKDLK